MGSRPVLWMGLRQGRLNSARWCARCRAHRVQVFWAALALLHCPVVGVYAAALDLLHAVMARLPLHRAKVQSVLLAAAPGGRGGHVPLLLQHALGGGAGGGAGSGRASAGGAGKATAWGTAGDTAFPGASALAAEEPGACQLLASCLPAWKHRVIEAGGSCR